MNITDQCVLLILSACIANRAGRSQYCSWFLYQMVAQIMLRTFDVKNGIFRKNIEFNDSFDVTKCLQQIEIPDSLSMCA